MKVATHETWQKSTLQQLQKQSPAQAISALQPWQTFALSDFLKNAFPHRKQEDWKYTPLQQITEHHFSMPAWAESGIAIPELNAIPEAYQIVFFNGKFQSQLSSFPEEIIVAETLNQLKESTWQSYLSFEADYATPFSMLNAALLTDGFFLCVPPNCVLTQPLHFIYYQSADRPTMHHARHFIFAKENSAFTVVEEYRGVGSYFNNIVTQIFAETGANLAHYKIQNESRGAQHVANTMITLARDSSVFSYVLSLGAHLSRDNLNINLQEQNSSCHLYGLYLPFAQQLIDHHTRVDHRVPNCFSQQAYKGIIAGSGRAVFNGKIHVHPGAQKTAALQNNQNLLLDPASEINTKPELEIYADDVKCTHGATVGQLDQNALFYLRSRGLEETFARNLLMQGFIEEVLLTISEPMIARYFQQKITEQWEMLL